ncbi:MAG: response regulator [Actinobacteria bacterium]|nr:MAG: response regulator [Actinomycetota bacterium]
MIPWGPSIPMDGRLRPTSDTEPPWSSRMNALPLAGSRIRKRGRPPAGRKPGERVKDYPQLAIRVPPHVRDTLRALGRATRMPQWRVLQEAITRYIDARPADERALLDGLIDRAEPLLSRPMRERVTPQPQMRILNVDDNDAMLFVKSRYLREEGYEVIEARTGARALELLGTRPHLVLLDVHLPDASGFDIVSRMLAGSVVLISTHDRQDYADLISRSGARGFLSKDQLSGVTLEALVSEG